MRTTTTITTIAIYATIGVPMIALSAVAVNYMMRRMRFMLSRDEKYRYANIANTTDATDVVDAEMVIEEQQVGHGTDDDGRGTMTLYQGPVVESGLIRPYDGLGDDARPKTRFVRDGESTRFQRFIVKHLQVEFGSLKTTVANREVVRRKCVSIMRSYGLRDSHIQQHSRLVVSMYFIRSVHDIDDQKLWYSDEVSRRETEYNARWYSGFFWSAAPVVFTEQ
jgi:hypothetical protein